MPKPGKSAYNAAALRMEAFVCAIIEGMSPKDAYKKAGYAPKSERVAVACASKMLARADVQARIEQLRKASTVASVLTLAEKRRFLALVVRTPLSAVDEASVLAQEYTAGGDKVRIKMVDKLRAIELDSKLAGELTGGVTQNNEDGAPIPAADVDGRVASILEKLLNVSLRPARAGQVVQEAEIVKPREDKLSRIALALAGEMANNPNHNEHRIEPKSR